MKNEYEYDCDIITDLFPLYLDRQVSYETDRLVAEHLKNCSACKEIYNSMACAIEIEPKATTDSKTKRSDYGMKHKTAMKPGKIRLVNVLLAVMFGYILLNLTVCMLIFVDIILF